MSDSNGGNPTAVSQILSGIAPQLREAIEQGEAQQTALEVQLSEVKRELTAARKLLAQVTGERSAPPPNKSRTHPSMVSPDRLLIVINAIEKFMETQDTDEFRQVDVRGFLSGPDSNSSVVAQAFAQLQNGGYIRLARRQGISKYYRLTRRSLSEAADLIRSGEKIGGTP